MMYRVLADLVMLAHFAFLAFLTVGGLLAWKWRWVIGPHLAACCWALLSVATGLECPLTLAEHWARRAAGQPGLPASGFIDHYIEGVIYPEEYTNLVRLAIAALVLASYAGYVLRRPGRPTGLYQLR